MSALGQKADIAARPRNVRFTPESGHRDSAAKCPLCAKKADQVRCSKKICLLAAALDYASHQGFSRLDLSVARKRAASPPVTAR